jgi:putative transposase
MPQSLCALGTHLVFSTKGRVKYLREDLRPRMHAYMATILHDLGCGQITVGGTADHVHVCFFLSKLHAPIKVVQVLKTESSVFAKTLHLKLAQFHWQTGYGMFGVSASHFETVRQYVIRQKEHHADETFKDEFRRLMREAGLEVDERYLWD